MDVNLLNLPKHLFPLVSAGEIAVDLRVAMATRRPGTARSQKAS